MIRATLIAPRHCLCRRRGGPRSRRTALAALLAAALGLALVGEPAGATDQTLERTYETLEQRDQRDTVRVKRATRVYLLAPAGSLAERRAARRLARAMRTGRSTARRAVRAIELEQPSSEVGGRAKEFALCGFRHSATFFTELRRSFRAALDARRIASERHLRRANRAGNASDRCLRQARREFLLAEEQRQAPTPVPPTASSHPAQ